MPQVKSVQFGAISGHSMALISAEAHLECRERVLHALHLLQSGHCRAARPEHPVRLLPHLITQFVLATMMAYAFSLSGQCLTCTQRAKVCRSCIYFSGR